MDLFGFVPQVRIASSIASTTSRSFERPAQRTVNVPCATAVVRPSAPSTRTVQFTWPTMSFVGMDPPHVPP